MLSSRFDSRCDRAQHHRKISSFFVSYQFLFGDKKVNILMGCFRFYCRIINYRTLCELNLFGETFSKPKVISENFTARKIPDHREIIIEHAKATHMKETTEASNGKASESETNVCDVEGGN